MSKLTDRAAFAGSLASGDLIHLVDVSDTSQDPAGSSFKLTLGVLATFVNATANTLEDVLLAGNTTNGNNIILDGATDRIDTDAGGDLLLGTSSAVNVQIGNNITTATISLVATSTLVGTMVASGTLSHTNINPFSMTRGQVVTATLIAQTVGPTTLTFPDFAGVNDEFVFKTKAVALTNKTLGAGTVITLGSDATGDVYYRAAGGALTRLAAGAAGTFLRFAGAGAAPVVSTLVLPNAATANRLVYATGTDTWGDSASLTFVSGTLTIAAHGGYEIEFTGAQGANIRHVQAGQDIYLSVNGAGLYFGSTTSGIHLSVVSTNVLVANKLFVGGSTTPTALLHIAAGTATASTAPLKLTTGPTLSVKEAGAWGYTTPQLFFTNGGLQEQEIPLIQQTRVLVQFDKTNTTMTAITSLTATVVAAKIYKFEAILFVTADLVGGSKFDLSGTATATSTIFEIQLLDNTTNANTITSKQTALGSAVGQAGTTDGFVRITGIIVVNGAGTLTPRFAQNAASGTSSVLVGSTFQIQEMA